jgi:tRNA1Val (adenine37-N6)-methyltransferase
MPAKPFQFKHFSVAHDRCTHKVGTDGVLLGSWVRIGDTDKFLLDVGTGSGVIALMLAQRSNDATHIDAIDIERQDAQQALQNVAGSPWPDKISVYQTAIQKFFPDQRYDLIISNPPFFVNSLLPPEQKRSQARHTHSLSFDDLLENVCRLLAASGRFAVILPYREGGQLLKAAAPLKLHPRRQTAFRSRRHKPFERLLIEFSRDITDPEESELRLYDEGEKWSEDYKALTRDFYLNA